MGRRENAEMRAEGYRGRQINRETDTEREEDMRQTDLCDLMFKPQGRDKRVRERQTNKQSRDTSREREQISWQR